MIVFSSFNYVERNQVEAHRLWNGIQGQQDLAGGEYRIQIRTEPSNKSTDSEANPRMIGEKWRKNSYSVSIKSIGGDGACLSV